MHHLSWQRAEIAFRARDFEAARHACERIVDADPDHAAANWMLSVIHQGQGRFRLATSHALAAAAASPLMAEQKLLVARCLIGVGRYRQAAELLAGIREAEIANIAACTTAADLTNMLDLHSATAGWLDVATARQYVNTTLILLRGNLCKFSGDIEGAAEAYEQAIRLNPDSPHAYLALATLSRPEFAEASANRVRLLLRSQPDSEPAGPGNSRAILQYALFRELDTLGDYDAAWLALVAAMRRRRSNFDPRKDDVLFDQLLTTYDEAFVSRATDSRNDATPIFILGLPRSGTTVIERVLGNHPLIAACGELSDLRMQYKWATDYYCPGTLDSEAARRMNIVDARAVGTAYLEATAWRTAGRHWFTDKLPANYVFAGFIARALPNARIIHVRRTPMDACFANLRELFAAGFYEYSYSIEDMANHYRNYDRLMTHTRDLLSDRLLEIDYEKFVAEPADQTSRILAFCGIPAREGLHDIASNTAPVSTASSVQVRQGIHSNRIDYWRRYERQLEPLQELLSQSAL
jgi:tetratricopeptide (TPR) repeat protein